MSAATPSETLTDSSSRRPEFDEIARLAYSYWEARGCQGGSPEDDWIRAERELNQQRSFGAQA